MLKTTSMLLDELGNYSNPKMKIHSMVKKGELYPVIRGLYETNKDVNLCSLATAVYSPSYISFEWALSFYGIIPERVYGCSCATYMKNRRKTYRTSFGTLFYRDVPAKVFPYGLTYASCDEGYPFAIAKLEKAVCDKLYTLPSVNNVAELEKLLFENLRFDEDVFATIDCDGLFEFAPLYRSRNVNLLCDLVVQRGSGCGRTCFGNCEKKTEQKQ